MELLDEQLPLGAKQVVELDHTVRQLVHRHADQQVGAEWRQVELDAGLGSRRLDEAVGVVEASDERAVRGNAAGRRPGVGRLKLRSEADDHDHLA
jgi:hypothetical protein